MEKKHTCTKVLPVTLSDHYLVYTIINQVPINVNHNIITCRTFKHLNIADFNNDMMVALQSLPIEDYSASTEQVWHDFKDGFMKVCDKHAPVRSYKVKKNSKPWITSDIVDKMNERDRLHKKANALKCDKLFNKYRTVRNQINKSIKLAKRNYFQQNSTPSKKVNQYGIQ